MLATQSDQESLQALSAALGGASLLVVVSLVIFLALLFILGLLVPWFVWRNKVYTKANYCRLGSLIAAVEGTNELLRRAEKRQTSTSSRSAN